MSEKLGQFTDVTTVDDTYHVPVLKKNTKNYNILPSDFAKSQSIYHSSATGITALAGGGQSGATALTKEYNKVTVVATDGDSVLMPAATVGKRIWVINADAAQNLNIFPSSGDNFEGLGADTAISLVFGASIEAFCFTSGEWTLL